MLSLKCPLLLLGFFLSIISPPISNLFLVCSTPPYTLLGLGPIIQRQIKLYLKRLQQEQKQCWWLCGQGIIRETVFETDHLAAAATNADELNIYVQNVSGTKDTYETLSSANNYISAAAPKPILCNMDSMSVFPTKHPPLHNHMSTNQFH